MAFSKDLEVDFNGTQNDLQERSLLKARKMKRSSKTLPRELVLHSFPARKSLREPLDSSKLAWDRSNARAST